MDPVVLGIAAIGLLIFLIGLGLPVAFGLGIVSLGGLWMVGGERLLTATIKTLPYNVSSEFTFVVIPMFVLMGALASASGMTSELYTAFYRFFSRIRGCLFIVTTLSSAGFAAISGSTIVNAAVFTRIALPQMQRFGYDLRIGAGCIAAAGTFAALIPPSIMMVIYALLTGESIGKLFIAGILPGILTAGIYILGIVIMVRMRPNWAPQKNERFPIGEKLESLKGVWPFALLSIIVLVGIYSGLMFPSSAGAVGATGAFLIMVARRQASGGVVYRCLSETVQTTTVLFTLILAGLLFSRFLVFSGFVNDIVAVIEQLEAGPVVVVAAIIGMYLVLGMFIDTVSVTVVTIPFVHPIIVSLGLDPIWFGVILIKLIEVSAITPPVGLNLFAVASSAEGRVSMAGLFRGVLPFILLEFLVLGLLLAFPQISLWLPARMMG